jgi:uncharacterized membrane protein HdeD (DUF308 family)
MFLAAAFQLFTLALLGDPVRWLFGTFGVLFLISAILAFISPENTFAAIAEILGFIFLIVGMTIGSAAGFEPRPSGYEPAQSYLDLVTRGLS